jgi:CopG antitoxin of type II toxin-antitoxin system
MEKTLKKHRLPDTDSVKELAEFWDAHQVTDFAHELKEVSEPVFVRAKGSSVSVELPPTESRHLKRIARSRGVKESTIVRQWIRERLREFYAARRKAERG